MSTDFPGDSPADCSGTLLSAGPISNVFALSPKKNSSGSSLSANRTMAAIEAKRLDLGLSIANLTSHAGLSARWYQKLVRRSTPPKTSVVRLLDRTLDRLEVRPDGLTDLDRHRTIFGSFLVAIAPHYGVTPDEVIASDPRIGATANLHWVACAHARQAALYLTVTHFDIPQRRLAKVLGLTPAAVCLALKSVEDRRDDPDFDAALRRAARLITGRDE